MRDFLRALLEIKLVKLEYPTKDWRVHHEWCVRVLGHYFKLTKIAAYGIGSVVILFSIWSLLKQGVSLFALALLTAGFLVIVIVNFIA